MRIFMATDSFKGSLSSASLCKLTKAVATSLSLDLSEELSLDCMPTGDGGEGTVEALTFGKKKERCMVPVFQKTLRKKKAFYIVCDGVAYIEAANVCGLSRENLKEDALLSFTSYGLGELLKAAAENSAVRALVVCLGGTGTTDCGAGALSALGGKFYDKRQREVGFLPTEIDRVVSVDLKKAREALLGKPLTVLCDVKNPLLGPLGTVSVFAPQKGATLLGQRYLTRTLSLFASALVQETRQALLQTSWVDDPLYSFECGGCAGGLGFALCYALQGTPQNGFSYLLQAQNAENRLCACDAILTGEGKLDAQSFMGKTVGSLCAIAKERHLPVAVVCGSKEEGLPLRDNLFVFPLTDQNPSVGECIFHAKEFYTAEVRLALSFLKDRYENFKNKNSEI